MKGRNEEIEGVNEREEERDLRALVDTRGSGGKEERKRRGEKKRAGGEGGCGGLANEGEGKKTSKQLEARRRPHFMLAGIGSL